MAKAEMRVAVRWRRQRLFRAVTWAGIRVAPYSLRTSEWLLNVATRRALRAEMSFGDPRWRRLPFGGKRWRRLPLERLQVTIERIDPTMATAGDIAP